MPNDPNSKPKPPRFVAPFFQTTWQVKIRFLILIFLTTGCGPQIFTTNDSDHNHHIVAPWPHTTKPDNPKSILSFDAPRGRSTSAHLESVTLLMIPRDSQDPVALSKLIENQLKFVIGQMHEIGGGANIATIQFSNLQFKESTNPSSLLIEATYDATMTIVWPITQSRPSQKSLYLPKRVDSQGLNEFWSTFGKQSSLTQNCLYALERNHASAETFWYHFRPNRPTCHIEDDQFKHQRQVIQSVLTMSDDNSELKYPEYHELWRDRRLTVTAIFAQDASNAAINNNQDPGMEAYRTFCELIVNTYGSSTTCPPPDFTPMAPTDMHSYQLITDISPGTLEIHALLVPNLSGHHPLFQNAYQTLSKRSDLIIYNGHAGYGSNPHRLIAMSHFIPSRYQIFFFNACSTFSYLSPSLTTAKKQLNPTSSAYKFIDIIANARPSFFKNSAAASLTLIKALAQPEQHLSYRALLTNLPAIQSPVVIGEEDNQFPAFF